MQNKPIQIQIKKGEVEEAFRLSQKMPEFEHSYPLEEYYKRLGQHKHLVLIARIADENVGFKVGYERQGAFYSWMGGVLPAYRQCGVAKALAGVQEEWARDEGFKKVFFKTWNRHKAMLIFSLKNGFDIVKVEPREKIEDFRIILEKQLSGVK